MLLAGDIGGTNARLGFCELEGERGQPVVIKTYASREYESLQLI